MHSVEFLEWYMTDKCYLKCKHCLNGSSPEQKADINELKSIANKIVSSKANLVNLSGGDPLVIDEIEEIYNIFNKSNTDITISTSGWKNDYETIKKMISNVKYGVQISLDAGNETIHDSIRGKEGAFKRAIKFMERVKEVDNKYDLQLCMTLNKLNKDEVKDVYKIASYYNVNRLKIQSLYPVGRASEEKGLFLNEEELESTLMKIKTLRDNKNETDVYYNDPLWTLKQYLKNKKINKMASIEPNGDIKIMPYLPFCFGNIKKDNFEQIFSDRMLDFFDTETFKLFYDDIECSKDLFNKEEKIIV